MGGIDPAPTEPRALLAGARSTSQGSLSHQMDILPLKEGYGGGGGIRTHGGFNTSPVFKTGAINRSTTPPFYYALV